MARMKEVDIRVQECAERIATAGWQAAREGESGLKLWAEIKETAYHEISSLVEELLLPEEHQERW